MKLRTIFYLIVYTTIVIFITTGINLMILPTIQRYEHQDRWKIKCPRKHIIVTSRELHGRLGCHIWNYLSVWAVAKHYGLWPVLPKVTIDELRPYFDDLSIESLEDLGERCDMPWLEEKFIDVKPVASLGHLLQTIENAGPNLTLIKIPYLIVHTEEVLNRWRELRNQLKFKHHINQAAHSKLLHISKEYWRNHANQMMLDTMTSQHLLEFVGVHVRRTDFLSMYNDVYPNASPPQPKFYLNAMQWFRDRINKAVIFVITSDDIKWCHENLVISHDIIIAGNTSTPGEDLALLGSCNHTILAHGTFGLSAAMFARGRHTLVYDPRNNVNTKEMEFVPYLPGWHALDNEGKSHYKAGEQTFKMPYRDGNTTNGFWYTY